MYQTTCHSVRYRLYFGWRHVIYLPASILAHALCLHLCLPSEKAMTGDTFLSRAVSKLSFRVELSLEQEAVLILAVESQATLLTLKSCPGRPCRDFHLVLVFLRNQRFAFTPSIKECLGAVC